MAVINIECLNRDLRVFSHKPVDFTPVVATLSKRELNLFNRGDMKAEEDGFGSGAELGTPLKRLDRLLMGSAGQRPTRQRQDR